MSNALAIAGVTAVIKGLIDDGLIDQQVATAVGHKVAVSALAPDAIALGNDAEPRLNLFLHQVTPNAAWRNAGYPSCDSSGQRIRNAPLALDLHYLLTAYGSADLQAELLLGYAMELLHETPVLARKAIRAALDPSGPSPNSVYQALRACDLADQIEQIKITPSAMSTEELSKLWTALQAHYRPTAPYQVTVVLIEPRKGGRAPLPVLTRGGTMPDPTDPARTVERGADVRTGMLPPLPELESIKLPNKGQIYALLGDEIELDGHDLVGANHALLLANQRLDVERAITPANSATASAVKFTLKDEPANYPAGIYAAVLRLDRGGTTRLTNPLALVIAPQLDLGPAALPDANGIPTLTVHPDAQRGLTLAPTCKPDLRPSQRVSLLLNDIEAVAEPFSTPISTPIFKFQGLATGKYWARLRVDGIDSLLVDRAASPPRFAGPQIEVQP